MGIVVAALVGPVDVAAGPRVKAGLDCESGVLDPGDAGLDVLVYRLCPDSLTFGFASSDVLEEVSCMPNGDVRLWLLAGNAGCRLPASDRDQVHELWEPLTSVGRSTAAPIRQLLLCRAGMMNRDRATIIVPDAHDALLEAQTGDTKYEALTRRLISACVRPNA